MALAELIRLRDREAVVQRMLTVLVTGTGNIDALTFEPTNYIAGDPLRTLLEIAGEAIADLEVTIVGLAEGGYLATASRGWLDELVGSHYNLTRQPSTFARGVVRFYAPATGGLSIPAGMIVGTLAGQKYQTSEATTIEAGSFVDLAVQAESPGSVYNVPVGSINQIHTPVPGLTVANLAGWLTQGGADEESDDSLRRRATLRWAELGGGATKAAYEYWALSAHPSVDRVRVLDEHPRGQGTADVVIWGTGGIGSDVVAAVNAYIQERRPVTADIAVYAAIERVVPVALQLYAPFGDRASIETQIMAGLAQLQQEAGIGSRLYRSQVIEVAMLPAGMLDAKTDFSDLQLENTEALTLEPTLTWRDTP